jgi:hypothetical protein
MLDDWKSLERVPGSSSLDWVRSKLQQTLIRTYASKECKRCAPEMSGTQPAVFGAHVRRTKKSHSIQAHM